MTATAITPRLPLTVAADLRAACAKRADNPTFMVDVFAMRVEETGAVFTAEVKQYWDSMDRPDSFPILGTVRKGAVEVWSFNADPRIKAGFKGRVRVVAHQGTTYVVFQSTGSKAAVHYVQTLSDLLLQRSPSMTPAQSGQVKLAIAKNSGINAILTKDEDDAVSYAVRVIYTDLADKARLEKVVNVHTNKATYRVVDVAGKLRHGPFPTLAEGQLAIGHVPQAPQTAPGEKTNVGGKNWQKGKSGDSGNSGKSKQPQKGSKGKKAA